jgi:hypothetical protein
MKKLGRVAPRLITEGRCSSQPVICLDKGRAEQHYVVRLVSSSEPGLLLCRCPSGKNHLRGRHPHNGWIGHYLAASTGVLPVSHSRLRRLRSLDFAESQRAVLESCGWAGRSSSSNITDASGLHDGTAFPSLLVLLTRFTACTVFVAFAPILQGASGSWSTAGAPAACLTSHAAGC